MSIETNEFVQNEVIEQAVQEKGMEYNEYVNDEI